ncbi:MarR family winged helix-turn-helix transcriptional regulator [Marinoscillum sp. MHG1-6]|uniref:MarR family winged helix-turn-helix transcriptional regulator n=1 Tax=Marinoscillum sp. MHG1-6 TaxID=2959627 RepID=UPI0021587B8C|nr:MarR family transcriptional regulator [Marinoscillum sp. MHG1-6]
MKREETIDYNIKVAWHAISRLYNQYGQKFDVTASTGFVLLNIDVEKGTPATKIAPLMGMEARSLTRMLKSMEEKKWIYREPDPTDGRSVRIFLTELGQQKREFSRQAVREFNNRMRNLVSEDKIKIFLEVAQTVTQLIENKDLIDQMANSFMEEVPKSK